MADPYQLSCSQEDLPSVPIVRSPGAPGDDGNADAADSQEDAIQPPPPRIDVAANRHERLAPPPELPALVRPVPSRRQERRLQETLDNIELLYALPRLQEAQLPIDLWTAMLALVPPGEEESFLFRYLFSSRLPSRLKAFALGLVNHPNWLMAEVSDYLWRTWLAGDPQGVPYFRPRVVAAAAATSRRGRPRRNRLPGRAPSAPAPPRGHSSPPRGCLCHFCRESTLRR